MQHDIKTGHQGAETMRAGQWDPQQKRIDINDVAVPTPAPGQLLIKLISASLCASDLLAIDYADPTNGPITLGHEGCGTVHAIGDNAKGKGYDVGDIVGFLSVQGACFECEGCQVHNTLCQKGQPLISGFATPGFFAEYALIDWQNAIRIPSRWETKVNDVAPFFCAGLTAFNSVERCGLLEGQWLAVIGAGGVGQLATQYAKAMSLRVVAIDVSNATLEVCKAQGADHVFNSKSDPDFADKVKQLTNGGVHAAAVYSSATAAYSTATSILRITGCLMFVGVAHQPIALNSQHIAIGICNVRGASYGVPQGMQRALDFSVLHDITPEVEHRKLDDLAVMVDEMRAGKATRRRAVVF